MCACAETIKLQITDLLNALSFYNNDVDLTIIELFNKLDYNSSQMEEIVIEGFRKNRKEIEFDYQTKLFQEFCRYLFFFDKIVINFGSIIVEFYQL